MRPNTTNANRQILTHHFALIGAFGRGGNCKASVQFSARMCRNEGKETGTNSIPQNIRNHHWPTAQRQAPMRSAGRLRWQRQTRTPRSGPGRRASVARRTAMDPPHTAPKTDVYRWLYGSSEAIHQLIHTFAPTKSTAHGTLHPLTRKKGEKEWPWPQRQPTMRTGGLSKRANRATCEEKDPPPPPSFLSCSHHTAMKTD